MKAANGRLPAHAAILIASDSPSDAALVKKLLAPDFDQVFVSIDPERATEDFDKQLPEVLILAFNAMSNSEAYYLGLYRLSEKIHLQPHRTLILCGKGEVQRAYEACKKEYFDDYVLFWPMTNDAPRLLMSVHRALRDLYAVEGSAPSVAAFAAQARHLAGLEETVGRQTALLNQRIDVANRFILSAEEEIGATLDRLASAVARDELTGKAAIEDVAALEREIARMKSGEISQRFQFVAEAMRPVSLWSDDFKAECRPHIESARVLTAMAGKVRPTILVVDDDDFQRKLVGEYLAAENYHLEFAAGGFEALTSLRKIRPNLILMDIMMSDLDGIEATRRLKAMPQFADVPVIMATGKSEGTSVRNSMSAGAFDFVVKPFDRNTLLAKVANALNSQ